MNNGHAVLGQLSRKRKRDSTSQMQVAANLAIEKRIKSSGRKKQNPVKAARKKQKDRRDQIKKHAKLEELKRVIKREQIRQKRAGTSTPNKTPNGTQNEAEAARKVRLLLENLTLKNGQWRSTWRSMQYE